MIALKKILPLVIAFALGVAITYVFLTMRFVAIQSAEQTLRNQQELDAIKEFYHQKELKEKAYKKEEKYWFDERLDQKAAETEKQTKKQQSQGDDMKSKFDQFGD